MFTQNMDALLYNEIIETFFVPFTAANYGFYSFVHQDNDSKHKSNLCRNTLDNYNLIWVYKKQKNIKIIN